MSDDTTKEPDAIRSVQDYVPKSKRRGRHTPESMRNRAQAEASRSPTVAEVREWIVAGSLAAAKKQYDELSGEHKRVFELQESAFMRVLEGMHARIAVLEEAQGIASPELSSIRAAFEAAIVEQQNAEPAEPK